MKTNLLLVTLLLACLNMQACTTSHAETGQVTTTDENKEQLAISFQFQRGGIASSQYAIWIENDKGELVRTVYATSYTVKGGYEVRKESIPTWVQKAKPGKMTDVQIDAITGATPRSSTLTYTWDGTDDKGNLVLPGKYHFYIEGSLYWKSRILFSGTVEWGGKGQSSIPIETRRFDASSTNENMISSLKASYYNPE